MEADLTPPPARPDRASFTDVFIKHPVLAIVVNLVIVLMGWRALTSLPVQQYPKIESASVLITTVYVGASAETIRGFLTTPIERAVSVAVAVAQPGVVPLHRQVDVGVVGTALRAAQ